MPKRGKQREPITTKNQCDHLLRIILIGNSNVGKSCLMMRFADEKFTCSYIATIGIDFKVKSFIMDGQLIKLQIWDTAGQERFQAVITAYYRNSDGVLLVYDITDEKSYESIRDWVRRVKAYAPTGVDFILVGNKCDLEAERKVSRERGEGLAAEYGIEYVEASGKENIGVQQAFAHLTRTVIRRKTNNPRFDSDYDTPPYHLSLDKGGEEGEEGCCA